MVRRYYIYGLLLGGFIRSHVKHEDLLDINSEDPYDGDQDFKETLNTNQAQLQGQEIV